MFQPIFFLLFFGLASCQPEKIESLKPGTCFEETNKSFAKTDLTYKTTFKIDKVDEQGDFFVSRWYDEAWIYQGKKPKNYFDSKAQFVFAKVQCPDTIDKAITLKEQLKKMKFDDGKDSKEKSDDTNKKKGK